MFVFCLGPGFLNLSTTDIWGQIILCWRQHVYCSILNSIPGPLDTRSMSSVVNPWGTKLPLAENLPPISMVPNLSCLLGPLGET